MHLMRRLMYAKSMLIQKSTSKLFAKHLKKFENGGLGKKIALIDLSNVMVDKMIIDLNPKAEYVLIDNFLDYQLLKAICPEVDLSLICTDDDGILEQFEKLQKLNIDMKFDYIIMNPPYDGQTNLYGKISLAAKQHANCVICLSPYLNYISNKKSFKDISNKLEKTLECYELIPFAVFDAAFDKELCIFKFGSRNENVKFEDLFWNKFSNIDLAKTIVNKFKNYNDYCNCHTVSYDDLDNYKFKCIMAFKRGHFDSQTGNPSWDWTTLFSKNYQTKFDWPKSDVKTSNCQAICFETEQECKNFCEYCNTDIVMFIIYAYKMSLSQSSNLQYIPFLKSYMNVITEEDLKIEFNLTDEELNYIHNEMKKFGWKTQNCKCA